jgi:DNA-binding transcriptional LysR family regulator
MELRQLEYFLAVVDERHFGRAAERLRIAQPGLSQQIKSLERSLGTQLLIRDSRRVDLTEAGEVLVDQARMIVELAARARETQRLVERGKHHLLRVATGAAGLGARVDAVLREFGARFGQVEVELVPGFGPQNLEALRRHAVDVAFVAKPAVLPAGSRYLRVGVVELLIVLPEAHPLAMLDPIPRGDLLKTSFVTWARGFNPELMRHIHRLLFGDVEHPSLVETSDLTQTTRLSLVARSGEYAGLALPSDKELGVPGVVYRRLEAPAPTLEYGVVWLDKHTSASVPQFVRVARELAALDRSPASP